MWRKNAITENEFSKQELREARGNGLKEDSAIDQASLLGTLGLTRPRKRRSRASESIAEGADPNWM
jgi:hypothetical protein